MITPYEQQEPQNETCGCCLRPNNPPCRMCPTCMEWVCAACDADETEMPDNCEGCQGRWLARNEPETVEAVPA